MRENREKSIDLRGVEGGEVNSAHCFEKQIAR